MVAMRGVAIESQSTSNAAQIGFLSEQNVDDPNYSMQYVVL
jgi:hypothetical protein